MIQPIPPSTPVRVEADFYPSLKNPAVALCSEVWEKIHAVTLNQTQSPYAAERCAGKAYRLAMPPLDGFRNICDFIACAGYGMLLGAIKEQNGTKLLYAAQVALATVPRESKTKSRTEPRPTANYPTPPPLLPQPHKNKRISSEKPISTYPDKELTTFAAGENPGQP